MKLFELPQIVTLSGIKVDSLADIDDVLGNVPSNVCEAGGGKNNSCNSGGGSGNSCTSGSD